MKPTNKEESGCDPVSSNCVIWQGPDITCISLCKGDSITNVVNKLAIEFCTLLETFNITNFDISCFNLAECTPKDFTELINLLITKICEDSGISTTDPVAGCPDCVVNTCSAFHYSNPTGDVITTMQLKDYVLAIGNKVCSIVGQILTINTAIADHESRILSLEGAPAPVLILPQLTPTCVLPSTPADLDVILAALEDQFCTLRNHTGNNTAITSALQAVCIGLNVSNQLNGIGQMQAITGWYTAPSNLSQSFSNLWKTVCDLRGAVQFIQNNCCDTGCSSINLLISSVLNNPTELVLTFTGTIPNNYVDSSISSSIEITDIGGGGPMIINGVQIKQTYFDPAQPLTLALTSGVNGANDVIVKTTYRFTDPSTGSTCENIIQTMVLGTDTCPDLILTADYTGVNYAFTWNGTLPTAAIIELYDAAEVLLLQSNVLNITTTNPSGNFSNLVEGVTYKIRLVLSGIPCNFESFVTLTYPCIAVTLNAPTLDYITPEGTTDGKTIAGWQITYNAAHP